MAKAPKPWKLTEEESFSSYTNWQTNIVYVLGQEDKFVPFLQADVSWLKRSDTQPNRGLQQAGELTPAVRVNTLNQMLGLIAQWVPHYLTNDIVYNSTNLNDVWSKIRKYYGFQQSEVNFMKFSSIVWEEGERPERLYQRLLAHVQDNLLTTGSKLKHDGATPTQNESISPTVERMVVLRWLELLHPGLPALVQRTFAYDLGHMTLKDIQPQVVDALDGFLAELKSEDVKSARVNMGRFKPSYRDNRRPYRPDTRSAPTQKRDTCRLCRAEGRPASHKLVDCDHITRAERRSLLGRSCAISDEMDSLDLQDDEPQVDPTLDANSSE